MQNSENIYAFQRSDVRKPSSISRLSVLCLLSHISFQYLTSPVEQLLSPVSPLFSHVSRLTSHGFRLTSPVAYLSLMSPVCFTSPVFRLLSVSHVLSHVSFSGPLVNIDRQEG